METYMPATGVICIEPDTVDTTDGYRICSIELKHNNAFIRVSTPSGDEIWLDCLKIGKDLDSLAT